MELFLNETQAPRTDMYRLCREVGTCQLMILHRHYRLNESIPDNSRKPTRLYSRQGWYTCDFTRLSLSPPSSPLSLDREAFTFWWVRRLAHSLWDSEHTRAGEHKLAGGVLKTHQGKFFQAVTRAKFIPAIVLHSSRIKIKKLIYKTPSNTNNNLPQLRTNYGQR
jgi:hypothetical protein